MSHPISAIRLSSNAGEGRWQFLYRTAAIAALITVALFLFQILASFVWPPPSTVAGNNRCNKHQDYDANRRLLGLSH